MKTFLFLLLQLCPALYLLFGYDITCVQSHQWILVVFRWFQYFGKQLCRGWYFNKDTSTTKYRNGSLKWKDKILMFIYKSIVNKF